MNSAFPPCPNRAEWRTLYRAAILESDQSVIPWKVSEAETAVLARRRELFYGGGTIDEKESLEDALYLLRAYRSACEYVESEIAGSPAKSAA